MTSPAKIAAGLTEAQKKALLGHPPRRYCQWQMPACDPLSFCKAGRALMDRELIEWHPDRRVSLTCVTPLGLAVRNHLLASKEGEC